MIALIKWELRQDEEAHIFSVGRVTESEYEKKKKLSHYHDKNRIHIGYMRVSLLFVLKLLTIPTSRPHLHPHPQPRPFCRLGKGKQAAINNSPFYHLPLQQLAYYYPLITFHPTLP